MPVFLIIILMQIAFAVHAVKTRRDSRWLYIILLFPLVDCGIYLIVEVLPGLRHSRRARNINRKVSDLINPYGNVHKHEDDLQFLRNVDNHIQLAEAYMGKELYDSAVKTYPKTLIGIYGNDPNLMLGLAKTYFYNTDYAEAKNTLEKLIQRNPAFKSAEGHLFYARTLNAIGKIEETLHEYDALVSYYPGPEAKYRYALLLKKQGRDTLAIAIFQEIVNAAKRSAHYRKLHKEWIALACQEC